MKKLLLTLFAIVFANIAFSQFDERETPIYSTYNPDSSYYYFYNDNMEIWDTAGMETYTYNQSGKLIMMISKNFNYQTQSFDLNDYKEERTYQGNNLIYQAGYHWDGSQWGISWAENRNYDQGGRVIAERNYGYTDGNWGITRYDSSLFTLNVNNDVETWIQLKYDTANFVWDTNGYYIFSEWDQNDKPILAYYIQGGDTVGKVIDVEWGLGYNNFIGSGTEPTAMTTLMRNDTGYINMEKSYSVINDNKLYEKYSQIWDTLSNDWIDDKKEIINYDNLNNLISYYNAEYDTLNEIWVPNKIDSLIYSYGSSDEITERITFWYDSQNDTLMYGQKFIYYYASNLNVNDVNNDVNVSLYPNPAKDYLNVNFTSNSNGEIEILNNVGQIVYSEKITKSSNSNHKISTSNLESGIYFIRIKNDSTAKTLKVVIE